MNKIIVAITIIGYMIKKKNHVLFRSELQNELYKCIANLTFTLHDQFKWIICLRETTCICMEQSSLEKMKNNSSLCLIIMQA